MGLRAQIALGIALPILLMLTLFSMAHYRHDRSLVEDQLRLTALQVGQSMMGGLRHTMMVNNRELLSQTLEDIANMETVHKVQIVDLDGRVRVSSDSGEVGTVRRPDDLGCVECHQFSDESRSQTSRLFPSSGVVRVSMPISNDPNCAHCHVGESAHLGVLLADISVIDSESRLSRNLQLSLAISLAIMVAVTLVLYLLMHRLVVRRVESFHRSLSEFAAGDFSARLPVSPGPTDELSELAGAFNRMADELDHHIKKQEKRTELRQQAIVEERERIARELHDGLAQLLGYVNTKAMAVRLMLMNHQTEAADRNLLQLEEAARGLFIDVREAILGLKMAGEDTSGLVGKFQDFAHEFSRLSDLPVELAIDEDIDSLDLSAEAELQLLRIVRESLNNIRKHALATSARIRLCVSDGALLLMISDNGKGFDADGVRNGNSRHFGLSAMSERAEAIGADFLLDSKPSAGTRITVRLPLTED